MSTARAYKLPTAANASKDAAVIALLPVWQRGLGRAQSEIVARLFYEGRIPRWINAKNWDGALSQRQWDSVNAQAIAAHKSWMGNLERVFRQMVGRSRLDDTTKADLNYINKANLWYLPTVNRETGELPEGGLVWVSKKRAISVEMFALARVIMRQAHKRVGRPDLRRVRTMVMDGKVAAVTPSSTPHADYWVKIATLTKGKPAQIPLRTHAAFDKRLARAGAVVANHCQVNVSRPDHNGQVEVSYRLVIKNDTAAPKTEGLDLALDWGLTTLFATSDGDLLGRGFLDRLRAYDVRLQPLLAALQRNHVKPTHSKRYRALAQDIREFVTNEVNRVLNALVRRADIRTLVVEELDFRGKGLSRQLRRIISKAGRAAVDKKLAALSEDEGIAIVEVNPAHTSRQCDRCGYTDKTNRRNQATFHCLYCGHRIHADVGGAVTLRERFARKQQWTYLSRHTVLARLDEQFQARWGLTFADVNSRRKQYPAPRVVRTPTPRTPVPQAAEGNEFLLVA